MTSWHTQSLRAFDLETTGVEVETARIVTAAVIDFTPRAADLDGLPDHSHLWLADPGVDIPAEATAVHGVTSEHARTLGRPAAEVVEEIARALTAALEMGVPVVAMNARFDFTILDRECRRHGLPSLEQRLCQPVGPVIDPFVLDKQADKYRRGSRKLEALAAHYGVELTDAHTADADARAAVEVAVAIAEKYPQLQVRADQLHAWQIQWAAEQAASFQEYKRRIDPTVVIDGSWPLVPYQPHQPRRGDAVEQWLKAQRDVQRDRFGRTPAWHNLDDLLDAYRLHADTRTPLGEHVCTAQAVGDCDCLETAP
ncbi:exonuclease domain-containing protein [Streptomyces sp. S186]|uniref:exonuclease domain-containing protein n=1 Tax=Streptomyces sp. S186 TaxID=3434395 RepID=UPI003F66CEBE